MSQRLITIGGPMVLRNIDDHELTIPPLKISKMIWICKHHVKLNKTRDVFGETIATYLREKCRLSTYILGFRSRDEIKFSSVGQIINEALITTKHNPFTYKLSSRGKLSCKDAFTVVTAELPSNDFPDYTIVPPDIPLDEVAARARPVETAIPILPLSEDVSRAIQVSGLNGRFLAESIIHLTKEADYLSIETGDHQCVTLFNDIVETLVRKRVITIIDKGYIDMVACNASCKTGLASDIEAYLSHIVSPPATSLWQEGMLVNFSKEEFEAIETIQKVSMYGTHNQKFWAYYNILAQKVKTRKVHKNPDEHGIMLTMNGAIVTPSAKTFGRLRTFWLIAVKMCLESQFGVAKAEEESCHEEEEVNLDELA